MTEEEKKHILLREVTKFKQLKTTLAEISKEPPPPKAPAAAEVPTPEKTELSEVQSIVQEAIARAVAEIKDLIRKEFEALKAELK